ncbi:uncharacterized protein LAESUDRAFT_641762 [Laetiporus sulphureus 93-53]|uniref:Uncharacterized protein n=1 Tax=Laetiporus sulphureus 93-53 TaxID=1314785 RepID=A0A165HRZ2_9APHY|nr:uncharacterized protein LAESUDRAFT_641762 [Laetiporus sulphureus 93-53]KZT12104.1 hypothetical protein LAESUDRAFT_641762 [Laetiporus sulphureus 93-53]
MKGSLSLWVVEPIIENMLQCKCILDQGVQICVMWKDVWEDLGAPLNLDRVILLETVNTLVIKMVRKLLCVWLHFRSVVIAVQVQVVHHAPFKIFLGGRSLLQQLARLETLPPESSRSHSQIHTRGSGS